MENTTVKAQGKYIRQSPYKMRLVLNLSKINVIKILALYTVYYNSQFYFLFIVVIHLLIFQTDLIQP